jgi:ribose transport system ATP-binding protein
LAELARLIQITKSFAGIRALDGVDFALQAGEVHALVGENGAGKSTLMRILGGELPPTTGQVVLDGKPIHLHGPNEARAHGIAIIHQELALAPDLSVAENIFLGELPGAISWPALRRRGGVLLQRLGFDIDPRAAVRKLSVAQQQVVEIAKALSLNARILVFDEPTSVLGTGDAERLLKIIRGLRDDGVGVVYISHRLEEIFRVSDRITVMKDGRVAGVVAPTEVDTDGLIKLMVGRSLKSMFAERAARRAAGDEVLRVEGLQAGRMVRDVSFSVRAGEVVGLGGLVGSGRTEVVRVIFGADRAHAGKIFLRGKEVRIHGPADAVRLRIGLVPESRKDQGVILPFSIRANSTMAKLRTVVNRLGFFRRRLERQVVGRLAESLRIKMSSAEAPVSSLSGGNQQKVVLAKWFHVDCDVIILDEPTRGVDVGAKTEIYGLIERMAEAGKAVLVISSEHQELFGLCDRILVMSEGQLKGQLTPESYSEERVLSLALGAGAKAAQGAN